ncbi:MAG: hypothetical protein LBL74_03815 [Bacteroidales bacterium]|jgi:hypothetical protein|nr:hypothetical protein [Bacteroidales bacterium]
MRHYSAAKLRKKAELQAMDKIKGCFIRTKGCFRKMKGCFILTKARDGLGKAHQVRIQQRARIFLALIIKS